jgi:transposase
VDVEVKQCTSCNATVKANLPKDMVGVLQYGNGVKAYAIQLIIAQVVALNRVVEMMEALIGRTISEATLLKYVMQLHLALETWEKRTIYQLYVSSCIHTDETLTLKMLYRKRGKRQ